ncbi:gamma-glutamyl-gamma-aminobutyraldehyde dehydrogenase [Actinomadura sp. NBRC 104425]|uniref:aldehyde dehydrogenase n=1 Tax=Actinomadura sp. NBRC 104425 TaxID=3032204 RepID=UPI0024A15A01|nr:aldehyde dehydrogenase [Actinomadura sp. NBRC 104425]GLZ11612.1 gamma-glutamyl-gamma-aminobutyraldehyde dehydrogenase [Actinomadura sp. NBRC 104425]
MPEHETADHWRERAAGIAPRTELFIDGAFTPAGDGATFASIGPRDGRELARISAAGEQDVDRAVRAAHAAFEDGRWSQAAPRHRKRVLLRLSELMRENLRELALLETLDVGKPIAESLRVDVPGAADCLRWYAEAIDKTYDEIAPTGPGALATVTREPLGVVGAVVPWNYPLIITAWKIAPALAMGNSVVLKPAEQSSLSALLLAELAAEAGVPDGVLNVVPGLGPVAGRALGRHPLVDKIAFTGSPRTGRAFLEYAGQSNGKQVALELGGKSPQIVFADAADLRAAAEAVAWGIFYNAGQTCNAGSRLLADERIADELLAEVVKTAESIKVGDPLDPATQMGPIVSREQLDRVLDYVDIGRAEGRLVTGGDRVTAGTDGYFIAPTVFDGVDNTARIAQEEIFGPVLTVTRFASEEQAVRLANDTRYGLAASVWTSRLTTAHRVAAAVRAGTVWVNTFDASDVITPFGGFKESGSGRDKSLHALDAYSALKTTWIDLESS